MKRNLLATLVLLTGVGLTLVAAPAARAGLIPNNVTVTPTGDGNYKWTYNVVVTSDVYVQPGDYFTIYDFAGAISGSGSAPTDWTLSTNNVGTTPEKTNPADDAAIPNYTWTYTGATTIFGQQLLGSFSLLSPYNHLADSDFTSAAHRQDNDHSEHTITSTVVPVASAGSKTPEPATLALFAAGLPLAGLLRRRRNS
ncbi:MAG TPA: PEP-CTERM sorting domain-containing protein [Gemmataceae bacterium]|jgi:hypothetical protein